MTEKGRKLLDRGGVATVVFLFIGLPWCLSSASWGTAFIFILALFAFWGLLAFIYGEGSMIEMAAVVVIASAVVAAVASSLVSARHRTSAPASTQSAPNFSN